MAKIIQIYVKTKDDDHEAKLFHLLYDNNFDLYVAPDCDKLPSTLREIRSILEHKQT